MRREELKKLRNTLQIQKQKADFRKEIERQKQELALARKQQAEERLRKQAESATIDLATFLQSKDAPGVQYTGTRVGRLVCVSAVLT